jgi:hypothetical protein
MEKGKQQQTHDKGMYLRFVAMILTAMVVMYWVMFIVSWELSHVRFSESRVFMAFAMGGTMGLTMLGWMLNMYHNTKLNVAILLASILLFGAGVALDRSQIIVDDIGFMNAMIPHHSLAITRAERARIEDIRVCELAHDISEAQRREISEMEWLVQDIERNGLATIPEEATSRPIPDFQVDPVRECP